MFYASRFSDKVGDGDEVDYSPSSSRGPRDAAYWLVYVVGCGGVAAIVGSFIMLWVFLSDSTPALLLPGSTTEAFVLRQQSRDLASQLMEIKKQLLKPESYNVSFYLDLCDKKNGKPWEKHPWRVEDPARAFLILKDTSCDKKENDGDELRRVVDLYVSHMAKKSTALQSRPSILYKDQISNGCTSIIPQPKTGLFFNDSLEFKSLDFLFIGEVTDSGPTKLLWDQAETLPGGGSSVVIRLEGDKAKDDGDEVPTCPENRMPTSRRCKIKDLDHLSPKIYAQLLELSKFQVVPNIADSLVSGGLLLSPFIREEDFPFPCDIDYMSVVIEIPSDEFEQNPGTTLAKFVMGMTPEELMVRRTALKEAADQLLDTEKRLENVLKHMAYKCFNRKYSIPCHWQ